MAATVQEAWQRVFALQDEGGQRSELIGYFHTAGQHLPELMREEVEAWDSLNHLKIVSAVEEVFGVKLSMDEIQSIDGLPRLAALIAAHRPA